MLPAVAFTRSDGVHLSVRTAVSPDQSSSAGVVNSVAQLPDQNRLSPLLLLPPIQEDQLQQLETASCVVSQGSISTSSSLLEGTSRQTSPAARCSQDAMLLLQAQVSAIGSK